MVLLQGVDKGGVVQPHACRIEMIRIGKMHVGLHRQLEIEIEIPDAFFSGQRGKRRGDLIVIDYRTQNFQRLRLTHQHDPAAALMHVIDDPSQIIQLKFLQFNAPRLRIGRFGVHLMRFHIAAGDIHLMLKRLLLGAIEKTGSSEKKIVQRGIQCVRRAQRQRHGRHFPRKRRIFG